jgi:flagellar biosynthetic protein FlhB
VAKDGPGGEKTEDPTPQRLKKARKEGQIPRTQELGTWAGAAVASFLLPILVGDAFDEVGRMFVQVGVVVEQPEVEAVTRCWARRSPPSSPSRCRWRWL